MTSQKIDDIIKIDDESLRKKTTSQHTLKKMGSEKKFLPKKQNKTKIRAKSFFTTSKMLRSPEDKQL